MEYLGQSSVLTKPGNEGLGVHGNTQVTRKEQGPGWVARLVRALSQHAKVAGSVPSQGTYKNQARNASVS